MLTSQTSRMATRPLRFLAILSLALPFAARAQAPRTPAPAIDRYFRLVRAEYSGDRAKELVAYMGGWFRWPGNTAFDASIDRVVSQLRDAGYVDEASATKATPLTYRIEKRPMRGPAWDVVDASLTIV